MAAFWEQIPLAGPLFGAVADSVENVALGTGLVMVTGLNAAADTVFGKERKQRGITEIPAWFVDKFSDKNQLVRTAKETVQDADDRPLAELTKAALSRFRSILGGVSATVHELKAGELEELIRGLWDLIGLVAHKVNPEALLKELPDLPRKVVRAALGRVGRSGIIQGAIFSNEINAATIGLVWNHLDELINFFLDLVECAKCYAPGSSLDGKAAAADTHGRYNELDMSQPMNRHAVICQIQRLVKSIILILQQSATAAKLDEINMTEQTSLKSDDFGLGTVLEVRPSGWQRLIDPGSEKQRLWARLPTSPGAKPEKLCAKSKLSDKPPKVTNEKWFFINGIATELFWLHLACEKLARHFQREITGVFNRGDGILWDLIECAGERNSNGESSAGSQKRLIQRTASSREAQRKLKEQLHNALMQASGGDTYEHVVVIAHSQGCLVLRLALEEMITSASSNTDSNNIRRAMLERLCVFTFGNPSVDWRLDWDSNGPLEPLKDSKQMDETVDLAFLSSHVLCTEHFANKADFVAKLGVLSEHKDQVKSGYERERVFINSEEDWVGHLFGTQYSLDPGHYMVERTGEQGENDVAGVTGETSVLFKCQGGDSIAEARKRVNL
ncbi:hypothetical protein VTI28DRAFT_7150 [Corynascus sepedonium]